jgi:hypothetical protein
LVSVTFAALLASVVSLVLAAVGVVSSARSASQTPQGVVTFTALSMIVGLIGFIVGISALTGFVLINV